MKKKKAKKPDTTLKGKKKKIQRKVMEKARENNKTMKVNCIKNTAERYTERY